MCVIDAFIGQLYLAALGFKGMDGSSPNWSASYHPSVILKIYIYGYLKLIQSSRRLEAEDNRNVELIWLVVRLNLDFKIIARFRKKNGPAIRKFVAIF